MFKCTYCRAGKGKYNSKLYYEPIIQDNKKHPEIVIKKNKVKSNYSKQGRLEEKKIVQSIIKQTLNSGAINNDGDLKVGELKLDSKKRNTTRSFTLTPDEYNKGINQNLDGWVITNQTNQRVYILTEKSFIKLVGDLYVNPN